MYESHSEFFSVAVDLFAYVCSIRASSVGYLTLALSSFALVWPDE